MNERLSNQEVFDVVAEALYAIDRALADLVVVRGRLKELVVELNRARAAETEHAS